jgi:hypothetical protein
MSRIGAGNVHRQAGEQQRQHQPLKRAPSPAIKDGSKSVHLLQLVESGHEFVFRYVVQTMRSIA